MTLYGENFGTQDGDLRVYAARVNDEGEELLKFEMFPNQEEPNVCKLFVHTHTMLRVCVPIGYGADLRIIVRVNGLRSKLGST